MAVDHHVEESVNQRSDPVLLPAEVVPALEYRGDVPRGREPDGDQCVGQHERRDAVLGQHRRRFRVGVGCGHVDGVHREEGVRGIDGGLHPLRGRHRVLHRPGVETQFLREIGERSVVGLVQVHPHQGVFFSEVIGDAVELEIVLKLS